MAPIFAECFCSWARRAVLGAIASGQLSRGRREEPLVLGGSKQAAEVILDVSDAVRAFVLGDEGQELEYR